MAVAIWLIGIVALASLWLVGYVRFLWRLPRGMKCLAEWQAEFAAAIAEPNRVGRVEFRVTDDLGPLLCRLPRNTVLFVPRSLWSELASPERLAILRHELAHLRRGDLWKSLVVRVLALPHWFNPLAWFAVRRFDDAAEWACDRAAMASEPTAYAAMLLRLSELAGTRARFGSAMSSRPLTTRIRRLLTLGGTEESAMKKACLISLLVLVLPLAIVRVNLVAEEPVQEPARDRSKLAQETSKPAVGEESLGLLTEKPAHAPAGEQSPSWVNPVQIAQRKMVEMAKKAYEAQQAAYESGTVTLDQVFLWSTLWLSSELAIADSRQAQLTAAQHHLQRMQSLEAVIRRLFETGVRGGEANAMYGASYYVADAERRLAEIEAMPEKQADAGRAAPNREMAEAARQGFEATTAAYQAGTSTLEAVISWSNRWLVAELEIAASREEQLVAAHAHLERIENLHNKIQSLYPTGSQGGEASVMATANYYLADAKRRKMQIEGSLQKSPAANHPRQPPQIAADELQQLLEPDEPSTAPQADQLPEPVVKPPGSTQYAPGAAAPSARLASPELPPQFVDPYGQSKAPVWTIGAKQVRLDRQDLAEVLRAAIRSGDIQQMCTAMMLVDMRLPRENGSDWRRTFPELAPDIVMLLDHEDARVRESAERALLWIRLPARDELRKAARSNNSEIATRAKWILAQGPEGKAEASRLFTRAMGVQEQQSTSPNATHSPADKLTWGGRDYALDDSEFPQALKTALQSGTAAEKLAALNLIRVSFEENGISYERVHTGYTPELIALVGDKDARICDRAEAVLWSIGSTKRELQQAAESDNPEIVRRSRRLLEGTGPIVDAAQAANLSVPLKQVGVSTVRPRLYNGKTFEQWREQLQTDLSPVLRKEAIGAMAEFAAHGYAKEGVEAIFNTMRDYSVWTIDNSPEGQLKQAAMASAEKMATADRLPAIVEALTSGNRNERLFALRIIPMDARKADLVPLLAAAVSGSDPEIAELAEAPLAIYDHDNSALIASIRSGLESTEQHKVQHALHMALGMIGGQFARESYPYPDQLPMALQLLDHADPAIRQIAINVLGTKSLEPGQTEYVEVLKKIAGSSDAQIAANARKMLEQLDPPLIDRRQ